MNELPKITISTEAEFFAHVIALKQESEDRLQGMADCLTEHNNPDAAEVFQQLSEYISDNIQQLETMAQGLELPEIAPWEYQWHCSDDPDAICMDQAHYMMSIRQSLELAMINEQRCVQFFQRVHTEVGHPGIMKLALQFITVEEKFAQIIQRRLLLIEDDDEPCEDFDPPNMPE